MNGKNKTILISDDAVLMTELLSNIIKKYDETCKVIVVNIEKTYIKFIEEKPDLVLLDICMGGDGNAGINVLEKIIKFNPLANVCMISVLGQKSVKDLCMNLGAKDFIVKPFEEEDIIQVLKNAKIYPKTSTNSMSLSIVRLKDMLNLIESKDEVLSEAWGFFSSLTFGGNVVAFVKDTFNKGRFVWQNTEYKKAFNVGDTQIGKTDYECWPSDIAKQLREHDLKIDADNKPVMLLEDVPLPTGKQRWMVYKFPYTDLGKRYIGGFGFIITDEILNNLKREIL
ncbi:hypothetical protein C0389_06880 [bacterium]|nr:hypothetical protein [bacterium]